MQIADVKCHVLRDPALDPDATSSAQTTILVELRTDETAGGEPLTGIGESDVHPLLAQAHILAPSTDSMGRGLREMLLDRDRPVDPLDVEGTWRRLYLGSAMNGRRGAGVHALGAVDMALHDLRGKAEGRPCHSYLRGGAVRDRITPYASLQPHAGDWDGYAGELVKWAQAAHRWGFRAAKLEITPAGPYAHLGLSADPHRMTDIVSAVRESTGPGMTLMVDAQYAFPGADACLEVIAGWGELDVSFLETPLLFDDLDGYAALVAESPVPIAQGEFLATRNEFAELVRHRALDILQPDVGRVGGLTEAARVVDLAEQHGLTVVPHAWKTGVSLAATAHLAAATAPGTMPYVEFLAPQLTTSALRQDLLTREMQMHDGQLLVPQTPGLGFEVDWDAVGHFEEAARTAWPGWNL